MLGRRLSRVWSRAALVAALLLPLSIGRGDADEAASTAEDPNAHLKTTQTIGSRTYTWTRLENRLTLRAPFNEAAGKLRVVTFFSPTCPRCLKNAGQVQTQFLNKNDSEDVEFFIVWVKSLSTDSEEKLPSAINQIFDPRVTHYWDDERVLNAQLLDAVMFDVNMRIYDVFLLYDGDEVWEKRLPRPGFFFHEVKRMPGPWWNIAQFISEMNKGLDNKPFSDPW